MAIVGPGAEQRVAENPKATLDGASEYEYVTLLNPLTDDFAVRVAQDVPVNLPFNIGKDATGRVSQVTNTEQDAKQVYGLNLKNPDFQGRKHIVNDVVIKAGQTINLKGNEAQVAVRQLVNEILQREGNKRMLADPHVRLEVEGRIIQKRGSIQELMDGNVQTPRTQIDEAINQSNEVNNEPEFPGLSQEDSPTNGEATDTANIPDSPAKTVGRPKKADS